MEMLKNSLSMPARKQHALLQSLHWNRLDSSVMATEDAQMQSLYWSTLDTGVLTALAEKKEDKKKDDAKCGCCGKTACGCCGSLADASIHNDGYYLAGNTLDKNSNVIIYGTGSTVSTSGGGIANGGGAGKVMGGGGGSAAKKGSSPAGGGAGKKR